MNFLTVFRRHGVAPQRRLTQPDWVEGRPKRPEAAQPDDAASWFDSSWLLREGLQITEHVSVGPVANDLPLGWWLEGPCAATTRVAVACAISPSSRRCR